MSSLTFQEIAVLWKADKRRWVKPSTYASYVNHVNKHLLPHFGALLPGQIDEACVQAYVQRKLQKLSIGTLRDSLRVLKMILHFGVRQCDWPRIDYEVHFPPSARKNRSVPVLAAADQRCLMDYLRGNFSFRNLGLLICLHSGLRVGEICGLQWKDLDMDAGVIRITKTVQRIWLDDDNERSYQLSIASPKTASSAREIPISRELMRLIRPLRKIMQPEYFVVSNAPFPLEPRYYRDYFRKLLLRLGLPPLRFHGLRHSFATRCIESKCDYKTLSSILGHTSISTTLDLYVHPGFSEKKNVIEKMAKRVTMK